MFTLKVIVAAADESIITAQPSLCPALIIKGKDSVSDLASKRVMVVGDGGGFITLAAPVIP